jgi:hypothetical protein
MGHGEVLFRFDAGSRTPTRLRTLRRVLTPFVRMRE